MKLPVIYAICVFNQSVPNIRTLSIITFIVRAIQSFWRHCCCDSTSVRRAHCSIVRLEDFAALCVVFIFIVYNRRRWSLWTELWTFSVWGNRRRSAYRACTKIYVSVLIYVTCTKVYLSVVIYRACTKIYVSVVIYKSYVLKYM